MSNIAAKPPHSQPSSSSNNTLRIVLASTFSILGAVLLVAGAVAYVKYFRPRRRSRRLSLGPRKNLDLTEEILHDLAAIEGGYGRREKPASMVSNSVTIDSGTTLAQSDEKAIEAGRVLPTRPPMSATELCYSPKTP